MRDFLFSQPISAPRPIQNRLESAAREFLTPAGGFGADFSKPPGEAALVPPDAVSWRVFKNPVALFIGGAAAVILELAEPRVRTGVWEHGSFRADPVLRLRRTGLAAMVTVYGARSAAEAMIVSVRKMHGRVRGKTPAGEPYSADDPELLNWVHATASYGFLQAYHAYVHPLSLRDRDAYYAGGASGAQLYGASNTPTSEEELRALFRAMRSRLEPSRIVFEFIHIVKRAPVMPRLLRPAQRLLVRAAVELLPADIRKLLGLGPAEGLRRYEIGLVRQAGALADRVLLQSSPAVQACLRVGLPVDYLYRGH